MGKGQLQLVTFEQAKKLKEAGFNWPTTGVFDAGDNFLFKEYRPINHNDYFFNGDISAPTIAVALKWFRDEKKNNCGVAVGTNRLYYGTVYLNNEDGYGGIYKCVIKRIDYEAAESALLDELLTVLESEQL